MKIGLLTLPLITNYGGGLLQAYALQVVLSKMGHETVTINRVIKKSFYTDLRANVKKILKNIIFSLKVSPTRGECRIIYSKSLSFMDKYMAYTQEIDSCENMIKLKKYKFDAYIVGSDQVWRPDYAPSVENYFLDFLENNNNVRKISYAASFGVDKWLFNSNQTKRISQLIKKFDFISVREKSAVDLCVNKLGVKPNHVLDPAMLLTKEEYYDLLKDSSLSDRKGLITSYVLDKTEFKDNIIGRISSYLNMPIFNAMPEDFSTMKHHEIEKCVFPSILEWIKSFIDAEFIITDSFHGAVLSIIFNKPFVVIQNIERGLCRFNSLLAIFHLEERLVSNIDQITRELIYKPIDYVAVNKILDDERSKSYAFIEKALS